MRIRSFAWCARAHLSELAVAAEARNNPCDAILRVALLSSMGHFYAIMWAQLNILGLDFTIDTAAHQLTLYSINNGLPFVMDKISINMLELLAAVAFAMVVATPWSHSVLCWIDSD
jgi:hypothetical protein